jgi:hypothetical protein
LNAAERSNSMAPGAAARWARVRDDIAAGD